MSDTVQTNVSDNAAGAIAYITLFPALIFLFLPPYSRSASIRFNAWQSIFLDIALIAINIILDYVLAPTLLGSATFFFTLTQLLFGLWILVWVMCAVGALSGRRFRLPVIGSFAERLART